MSGLVAQAPPAGSGAATLRRRTEEPWSPTLVRYARYLIGTGAESSVAYANDGRRHEGPATLVPDEQGLVVRIGSQSHRFADLTYLSLA